MTEELRVKDKMLEDANDQIVCLKSKLHGLRTIINQLRTVEKKYNVLLSKKKHQKQGRVKS